MNTTASQFSLYRRLAADLARQALGRGSDHEPPASAGLSVALGRPAARLLLADDPTLYDGLAAGFKALASPAALSDDAPVADLAGHRRSVYHLLLLHLHLAAFGRRYEQLRPGQWSICEAALPQAVEPARRCQLYLDRPPPPSQVHLVLWQALCLAEQARLSGRDVDQEVADSVVHHIIAVAVPDGALHARDESESLDAWTFHELAGLHALGLLALGRRRREWARRVEEVATYHLENTQPDNVTSQPWGLFAFCWSPATRSFADQQLHDTTTHLSVAGHGGEGVAGLLLADAADALAEFGG
jgi:hypothetical protein